MANWSSIRDSCEGFIQRWKPELQIYGIGFLLMASALYTGRMAAALVIFGLLILAHLMHHYGEPYRRHGEAEFGRRKIRHREYWDQVFASLRSKLKPGGPDHPLTPPTRVIAAPAGSEDDGGRPESPAPIKEPAACTGTPKPTVTHET